jgi:hypothetical protein
MSGLLRHAEGVEVRTPAEGPAVRTAVFACCHCGRIWREQKGSGKRRGFCLLCSARTCGDAACDECVPLEVQLSNIEAGRDPLTPRPVCVSTAGILVVGG